MPIPSLNYIKNIFNGTKEPEDKQELYKELFLLTLARAAKADLYTNEKEVQKVQDILSTLFDGEVTVAEIRTMASSELFESMPLKKYLERTGHHLDPEHKKAIVQGLVDVVGSDGLVSDREIEYFNMVVTALNLTPAEVIGLRAS